VASVGVVEPDIEFFACVASQIGVLAPGVADRIATGVSLCRHPHDRARP
jgi:hypothetical protein